MARQNLVDKESIALLRAKSLSEQSSRSDICGMTRALNDDGVPCESQSEQSNVLDRNCNERFQVGFDICPLGSVGSRGLS